MVPVTEGIASAVPPASVAVVEGVAAHPRKPAESERQSGKTRREWNSEDIGQVWCGHGGHVFAFCGARATRGCQPDPPRATLFAVSEAIYQPFPIPTAARAHIWRHVPATKRPRHFHAEPELNLVAAGSATFGMGELVLAVSGGDLLWWPPGQDHVLLESSPDFDLFVIGVSQEFSLRVLAGDAETVRVGPVQSRLLPETLEEFGEICSAPVNAFDVPAIERRVGDLWREAHRMRATECSMHTLTRRTLVSLSERPDLARSDVAQLLRAYPTEVSRHFHKDMGVTLTAYRSRLRILRFIQAVDGGAENLLAAAMDAGFGSYSQCHRTFQQTFACTPRAFFGTTVRTAMQEAFSP
jgi:AraC-like DNA-binding protein/mannose-6-phosphate isomerase-like protein (cupin superfamily)